MPSKTALAEGELPFWNRYNAAGVDLLAQGQSMFGDPLHLLVLACFVPVLARRARTAPESCVLVPVAALGAWVAVNVVGVLVLGWRA